MINFSFIIYSHTDKNDDLTDKKINKDKRQYTEKRGRKLMLKIIKLKVGIEDILESIYFDGTIKELNKAMDGVRNIKFLREKVLENKFTTIYVHPKNIAFIEVDDYEKKEKNNTKGKVLFFDNEEESKKEEKDLDYYDEIMKNNKEAFDILQKFIKKLIDSAKDQEALENAGMLGEVLTEYFLDHHKFKTDDRDKEIENILEEQIKSYKHVVEQLRESIDYEKIKNIHIKINKDLLSSNRHYKQDKNNLSQEEEAEFLIDIFMSSFYFIQWLLTGIEENKLKKDIEENNIEKIKNSFVFSFFNERRTKEEN